MQTCLQLPSGYAAGKAFWRMKKDKFDIGRGCSNDFVKLQNLAPNADKSDDEGSTANEVKVSILYVRPIASSSEFSQCHVPH